MNRESKFVNQKNGFSLIELLVVVAILGGLAVATSRIFFASLRGSEKTQGLIEVRQAGDQAMLTMKKKIRVARNIDASVIDCRAGASGDAIKFVRRNPKARGFASAQTIETTFNCAGIGGAQLYMEERNSDGSIRVASTALTPSFLTVPNCIDSRNIFSCQKSAGVPAKVTINFDLQRPDTGEILNFNSTVSLRNF